MKYICLILLLSALSASGQDALTEVKKQAFGNPYNAANENFINLMNEMATPGRVSLLLFEGWQEMEILGKDSSWVIVDSANYHIGEDKVFFFNDGQFYQLFPERVQQLTMAGRQFVHANYVHKKSIEKSYFEVLEDGAFRLLKRHEIERNVRNDNPMGLPAAKEVEVKQGGELYYLPGTARRPLPLPRKKRDLIMAFRRNRTEVAAFASEEKLSLRKEDDIRALFAYYNQLADARR